MLTLPASVRIFFATAPVDMRKSIDGLAALGMCGALEAAYADRVESIAAKAAFFSLGRRSSEEYRRHLLDRVDESRAGSIVALLGGVIE